MYHQLETCKHRTNKNSANNHHCDKSSNNRFRYDKNNQRNDKNNKNRPLLQEKPSQWQKQISIASVTTRVTITVTKTISTVPATIKQNNYVLPKQQKQQPQHQ